MKTKHHPLRSGRTGYPARVHPGRPRPRAPPTRIRLVRGGLSQDLTLSRVDVRLKPRQDALTAKPISDRVGFMLPCPPRTAPLSRSATSHAVADRLLGGGGASAGTRPVISQISAPSRGSPSVSTAGY